MPYIYAVHHPLTKYLAGICRHAADPCLLLIFFARQSFSKKERRRNGEKIREGSCPSAPLPLQKEGLQCIFVQRHAARTIHKGHILQPFPALFTEPLRGLIAILSINIDSFRTLPMKQIIETGPYRLAGIPLPLISWVQHPTGHVRVRFPDAVCIVATIGTYAINPLLSDGHNLSAQCCPLVFSFAVKTWQNVRFLKPVSYTNDNCAELFLSIFIKAHSIVPAL